MSDLKKEVISALGSLVEKNGWFIEQNPVNNYYTKFLYSTSTFVLTFSPFECYTSVDSRLDRHSAELKVRCIFTCEKVDKVVVLDSEEFPEILELYKKLAEKNKSIRVGSVEDLIFFLKEVRSHLDNGR